MPALIFHASSVKINNATVLFSGVSGQGKTTLYQRFLAQGYSGFGDDLAVVYSNSKGIWNLYSAVSNIDGNTIVSADEVHVPVRYMIFLEKHVSSGFELLESDNMEAAIKNYQNLRIAHHIEDHRQDMINTFRWVCDFARVVPSADLNFSLDSDLIDSLSSLLNERLTA